MNAVELSKLLMEQQLLVFGKIFRKGPNDVLRKVIFEENSSALQIHAKMRRRGRPKLAWVVEVRKVATTITVEELHASCSLKRRRVCGGLAT